MAAILGIVVSLLGPAIELGKCFKKQLNYLCCFQTNVNALTDAAKDLEPVQADLQERVDGANRNGELILHEVEAWVAKAGETQSIIHEIGTTPKPRILNLKSRYSLSRKAKKTVESINELRGSKFDHVSSPAQPASMTPTFPSLQTKEIESRKNIEEEIIKAMRDEKVYVIGIPGMGGVGKTTMAKEIMYRAKENGLFDEVLLVPVGQQGNMLNIQHGIADMLGLKLEQDTLEPRAHRLRARLEGGKRKLIVIDDVWERINLEDLGIPCESGSCTILLTSRDTRVLRQMNAQPIFTIQILSEEEAWSMFQENVGVCLDNNPLARDVAKECKGLPLALVVVSRALKDEVNIRIWSNALKQLKRSNPMDIEDVIKDVYNPIMLSYDSLGSQLHAKSLWFLCSSFPEDHEISLEYLAFYGLGLGIFEDINTLEEARNSTAGLVVTLKKRFMILDGKDEHYVKMHDVVRDVAIFIATKDNQAILEFTSPDCSKQNIHKDNCNMLSVIQKQRQFVFPMGLIFPKLNFLRMDMAGYGFPQMSDNFLEGMPQLKVLSISWVSLGLTLKNMILLKNLRTLHLYSCNLETLSPVGKLSSLEILCCDSCQLITELPVEIGELQCLRLLEVTNCRNLKTIVPDVISKLGELEELKVLDGFKGWESEEVENQRRNASLVELHSLSKLICLEIEIEDWSADAQVSQLSSKIVKFDIHVGKMSRFAPRRKTSSSTHEKKLSISLQMCPSLVNWIAVFARTVEHLCLDGVDSNGFDFSGHQNLRCLVFENCKKVVRLVSSASTDWGIGVFPVLEELYLANLPKLEEICHDPIPDGSKNQDVLLTNLSHLMILGCRKLHRVFSSSVVIRSLSQLRSLEIIDCESMDEVFWTEKNDGNSPSSCITFPKLETLKLRNLESLTHFCKGIDIIEFPQLVLLGIENCPKLKSFGKTYDDNHLNSLGGHDSIHIFCNTKITFGSLKTVNFGGYHISGINTLWCHHIPHLFFRQLEELEIYHIGDITDLFSYSVAANLVNLKTLNIVSCHEMRYVIADDDAEISETKPQHIIFHKLEDLTLNDLPMLQNFCEGRWDLQLPSLKRLYIQNVGFYSTREYVHLFCNIQITFDKLRHLHIEGGDRDPIKHLFSYSVAGNLVNLEALRISNFSEMAYVIADDVDDIAKTSGNNPQTIFRKLIQVKLTYLPKLQSLCDCGWDVQFPLLEILIITSCPGMKGVTPESIRKQNMEAVQSRRLAKQRV